MTTSLISVGIRLPAAAAEHVATALALIADVDKPPWQPITRHDGSSSGRICTITLSGGTDVAVTEREPAAYPRVLSLLTTDFAGAVQRCRDAGITVGTPPSGTSVGYVRPIGDGFAIRLVEAKDPS